MHIFLWHSVVQSDATLTAESVSMVSVKAGTAVAADSIVAVGILMAFIDVQNAFVYVWNQATIETLGAHNLFAPPILFTLSTK